MSEVPFTKMQGLGNDFVVLEGPIDLDDTGVRAMCDRRRGIGADGVLVVIKGDPVGMLYWNADGSAAEMCGNGLRCVARYAYDRGWSDGPSFVVDTASGRRRVTVGDGWVEAELGPTTVTGHTSIDGARYHLIDVGNPHAVVLVDDPDMADVDGIGPRLQSDEQFPRGTNVEFARVEDGAVRMRVWERGVGETLACGTGMVAAAMVAAKTARIEGRIPVHVRGGVGTVEFRDGVAWLAGPAAYSFTGVWPTGSAAGR